MALRIAVVSTSRIAKPHNPSPFFSPSFQNLALKFHLPPRLLHSNAFSPLPVRKLGSQCYIRAISDAAVESRVSKKEEEEEQSPKDWKIKMLYDGDCPLCMREAMGRIHAILSDGTVVTDVEAFRRLYEEVGLGWVYAVTKYEPIAKIADSVYSFWAKYRLQVTGRPPIEEILEARKKKENKDGDEN
ncbi:hypothetical protein TSUD_216110 [Trifolium subterraneum]|uniref:Thiol-disulfide oxidoreductase DCC n=1 Tax=Trifolium subterraneum TaxID=3900 RepID=A0A2Z6M895_TRISU|nr:hypothetical protein TSUD_216110 [Trifolium subterraneum]